MSSSESPLTWRVDEYRLSPGRSNSTAHAIELTRDAEAGGADAILSVVPYYNKPVQPDCTHISARSLNRPNFRPFFTTCRHGRPVVLRTRRLPFGRAAANHRSQGCDRRRDEVVPIEVARRLLIGIFCLAMTRPPSRFLPRAATDVYPSPPMSRLAFAA